MKPRNLLLGLLAVVALSGCQVLDRVFCHDCRSQSQASSSSLVSFLYPRGDGIPRENSIPQLNLPVRVGIAFVPSASRATSDGPEAARRDEILERIRKKFADRKFVSQIVVIPDYYLDGRAGFEGLKGVQRLYGVDVMALVSYDQVSYRDDNALSLGYLTIVGAYILPGSRHDVVTLMDLAVIDPNSRSIVLRAGGTDNRHATSTMVSERREARDSRTESFSAATDSLIKNFDQALVRFESDVREGRANVKVTRSNGGGGSLDIVCLAVLGMVLLALQRRRMVQSA